MTPLVKYVYQPVADRVMDRFHRSCYWLAGQCAVGVVGAWLGAVVAYWFAKDYEMDWYGVGFLPILSFMMHMDWQKAVTEDRRFWDRGNALPTRLPAVFLIALEGMWVGFFALNALAFWLNSGLWSHVRTGCFLAYGLLFMSINCFMHCIPKPPKRKEAKEPRFAKPLVVGLQ